MPSFRPNGWIQRGLRAASILGLDLTTICPCYDLTLSMRPEYIWCSNLSPSKRVLLGLSESKSKD